MTSSYAHILLLPWRIIVLIGSLSYEAKEWTTFHPKPRWNRICRLTEWEFLPSKWSNTNVVYTHINICSQIALLEPFSKSAPLTHFQDFQHTNVRVQAWIATPRISNKHVLSVLKAASQGGNRSIIKGRATEKKNLESRRPIPTSLTHH